MRKYLTRLIGNASLRQRLGDELARGAFSHAYIIQGDEDSGKHTLAREIVMALACEHRTDPSYPLPCGTCAHCRKILEGNCPDMLTISREEDRATMGVDTVRALRESVYTLPNDLDFKVFIVEDAQTMTTAAQNALLLTLEEPPPFVLFLLLATKADALLETIRSRAPVLRMQPVDDRTLTDYLLRCEQSSIARTASALHDNAPEEFAALLRMADGRVGRAKTLLEEKKRAPLLSRRANALRFCELLSDTTKHAELLMHLYALGKSREAVTEHLSCYGAALRDLLALSVCDTAPLLFFTDREQALDLSSAFTTARLLFIIEATDQALASLTSSANVRLTITHYLCRLASAL